MNNGIYAEIFLRKSVPFIYKLVVIMFILIIICIVYILNIDYYSVINTKGVVKVIDNEYYLVISVKEDDVKYLVNGDYFMFNDKFVYYKIVDIDEDVYSDNNDNYRVIYLKAMLDKKYRVNNLNLDIRINRENKKIINYVIDYLKER